MKEKVWREWGGEREENESRRKKEKNKNQQPQHETGSFGSVALGHVPKDTIKCQNKYSKWWVYRMSTSLLALRFSVFPGFHIYIWWVYLTLEWGCREERKITNHCFRSNAHLRFKPKCLNCGKCWWISKTIASINLGSDFDPINCVWVDCGPYLKAETAKHAIIPSAESNCELLRPTHWVLGVGL